MATRHEERIRERAYHLWRQSGGQQGSEMDHWLQAEREMAEAAPASAGPAQASKKAAPAPKETAPAPKKAAARPSAGKAPGEGAGKWSRRAAAVAA